MNRPEAIEILEAMAMAESTFSDEESKKCCEAIDLAVEALKREGASFDEPLTLEQLLEKDGEPVYIPEIECWALVKREHTTLLFVFSDGKQCPASEWYEQVGPVYRRLTKA